MPRLFKSIRTWSLLLATIIVSGCANLPDGIQPVEQFDAQRYLGRWYEIARLDHRFERGLSNVSATYSRNDDGSIKVLNRGYRDSEQKWTQALGRAKFAKAPTQGFLKVSFFGPFYGSYVVFDLDKDYSRAYVAGPNRKYLWFLSRTPSVSDEQKQAFLSQVEQLGFAIDNIIFVDQGLGDRP